MRISRPAVELLIVVALTFIAWAGAETYARARGTDAPLGERRDLVALFPAPSPLSVHLTQEERLIVGAGQRAPIIGAVLILAIVVRRRAGHG